MLADALARLGIRFSAAPLTRRAHRAVRMAPSIRAVSRASWTVPPGVWARYGVSEPSTHANDWQRLNRCIELRNVMTTQGAPEALVDMVCEQCFALALAIDRARGQ